MAITKQGYSGGSGGTESIDNVPETSKVIEVRVREGNGGSGPVRFGWLVW